MIQQFKGQASVFTGINVKYRLAHLKRSQLVKKTNKQTNKNNNKKPSKSMVL